jgi:carboxypeptidase Taq
MIARSTSTAYSQLETLFAKADTLAEVLSLLHWDMATMMPEGGFERRSQQLSAISAIHHDTLTAPHLPELLAQAQSQELSPWQQANVREMRRLWIHEAALPADLVEASVKASSTTEMIWREAREKADFGMVLPHLQTLLDLKREQAQAKSEALSVGLYDALLDQYEPSGRTAGIDLIFAELEAFLPGFLAQTLETQARHPKPRLPAAPFAVEHQKDLARQLMTALGFDFDHGRLDASHHPFCGGYPGDIRITTRYDEMDFTSAMMGVLHETGHSLYEFGLPSQQWPGQPVAAARGMILHESQSLLMEMQACRSRPFIGWATPKLEAMFGGTDSWDADNLYRHGIWVEPGFIRVDADEVTYPAHVIIRYRIEKDLIEGRMDLADLPQIWNQSYQNLLGITPPNDRLGCLQDIHWYGGSFGYFPTYTLGALCAAQLFQAALKADPTILDSIGQGNFSPLLAWLRPNIHHKGSSLSTQDLLIEATGKPLDPGFFINHLKNRYG